MILTEKDFNGFDFLPKGDDGTPYLGVADGWYLILYWTFMWIDLYLRACINEGQTEFANDFKITTIKEKYGHLRIQTTESDCIIWHLIQDAEDASAYICECCGRLGKTRPLPWIKTFCKKHYWQAIWSYKEELPVNEFLWLLWNCITK